MFQPLVLHRKNPRDYSPTDSSWDEAKKDARKLAQEKFGSASELQIRAALKGMEGREGEFKDRGGRAYGAFLVYREAVESLFERRFGPRLNPSVNVSRYEFVDGISNKFWEVSTRDSNLVMSWGRIGTKGQTMEQAYSSPREATIEGLKLIEKKLARGYHHVRPGAGAAPRPVNPKAKAGPKSKAKPKPKAKAKGSKSKAKPKAKPKPKSKMKGAKPKSKPKPKKVAKAKASKPKPAESTRFSSTRSPEFQQAVREAVREINALPRPKKHFMEGGDGVSGYGRIEVFGVHGAGKRGFRVSAGPDEWNSAIEERARQIVKKTFGPNAYFIVNID